MLQLIGFLLLLITFAGCGSTRAGLFWEITGPNAKDTSYLFGTFHVMRGGFVDSLPRVTQRLERAEAVIGEMELDMKDMFAGLADLRSPTPLNKLLSEPDYRFTDSVFRAITGSGLGLFNMLKPMAASAQLSKSLFEKSGLIAHSSGESVIDVYFQEEARQRSKEIIGLETMQEQMQILFGDFPIERQAEMLLEMARNIDEATQEMKLLTECYVKDDLSCLEARSDAMSGGLSSDEMERMVRVRNEKWMSTLLQIIPVKRAFIAVGALHLPGEYGLIELLRSRGYRLTSIPLR